VFGTEASEFLAVFQIAMLGGLPSTNPQGRDHDTSNTGEGLTVLLANAPTKQAGKAA
jgi:hypothetical protein